MYLKKIADSDWNYVHLLLQLTLTKVYWYIVSLKDIEINNQFQCKLLK